MSVQFTMPETQQLLLGLRCYVCEAGDSASLFGPSSCCTSIISTTRGIDKQLCKVLRSAILREIESWR